MGSDDLNKRIIDNLVVLKGSNSAVWGADSSVYVFDGSFEGEFSELSVPRSGGRSMAVALLEKANAALDDGSAVVHPVVKRSVMGGGRTIKFSMFDHRSNIMFPKHRSEISQSYPLAAVIVSIRLRFLLNLDILDVNHQTVVIFPVSVSSVRHRTCYDFIAFARFPSCERIWPSISVVVARMGWETSS